MASSGSRNDPALAQLAISMQQGGERVVRLAREQMKREADKITILAKSNAPVLHDGPEEMESYDGTPGNLEQSIQRVDSYDDSQHGRLQIDIVAGGIVNGVDVDKYLMLIHEGLRPYGSGAAGSIGRLSQQKSFAGNDVGGLFMDRALRARQDKIPDEINAAIADAVEDIGS